MDKKQALKLKNPEMLEPRIAPLPWFIPLPGPVPPPNIPLPPPPDFPAYLIPPGAK